MIITTSDFPSQVYGQTWTGCCVFIDKPFSFELSKNTLLFEQNGKITFESGTILFHPWRLTAEMRGLSSNVLSLCMALSNSKIDVKPKPVNWLLAYDKSAAFNFSDGMLQSIISTRTSVKSSNKQRIIKSGYGIQQKIQGLSPHATVIPINQSLDDLPDYKYCIQNYVKVIREFRSYSFFYNSSFNSIILETPCGSLDDPDWRNSMQLDDLVIKEYQSLMIDDLIKSAHKQLDLEYLCLDIVSDGTDIAIVDINPHGSWYWLPKTINERISCMFYDYVGEIFKGNVNGQ